MRARLVFILLALVLVGGFAYQNWAEFTRASTLSFGVIEATVPLGVLLLGVLAVVLAVFLLSSAAQESRHLLDQRRTNRALQAQRDLAEKAEASRYTELRQHIDTRLQDVRTQGTVASSDFERSMLQGQRELRTQMEQVLHVLASRLGDIEARLGSAPLDRTVIEHPAERPVDRPRASTLERDSLRAAVSGDDVSDIPPRDRMRL